jgi:hypothetical protein
MVISWFAKISYGVIHIQAKIRNQWQHHQFSTNITSLCAGNVFDIGRKKWLPDANTTSVH